MKITSSMAIVAGQKLDENFATSLNVKYVNNNK